MGGKHKPKEINLDAPKYRKEEKNPVAEEEAPEEPPAQEDAAEQNAPSTLEKVGPREELTAELKHELAKPSTVENLIRTFDIEVDAFIHKIHDKIEYREFSTYSMSRYLRSILGNTLIDENHWRINTKKHTANNGKQPQKPRHYTDREVVGAPQ